LKRSSIGSFAIAARLPDNTVLKRLDLCELRLLLHDRRHAVQAIDDLGVHRVLDPERAVLVEGGNALFWRYKLWARVVGGCVYELDDCLFGGTIIP
jgi:hypothetical protein